MSELQRRAFIDEFADHFDGNIKMVSTDRKMPRSVERAKVFADVCRYGGLSHG